MIEFALNRGAVTGYRFVINVNREVRFVASLNEDEYQDLLAEVKRLEGEETPRTVDTAYKLCL